MTKFKKVNYIKDNLKASPEHTFYHYKLQLPEPLCNWDVFDYWERERIESMHDNLVKKDILFEIGAEHGWMSVILSSFCKMFLIEPTKEFWPNIYQTFEANKCPTPIGCYSGLVGRKTTDNIKDFSWPDNIHDEMIGANKYEYIDQHSSDIKQMTIDQIVKRSGIVPTALNIDVEGSELEVLIGATQTLKKYHPKLWISIHPDLMLQRHKHTKKKLFNKLEKLGYKSEHLATDHEEHWYFKYEK